MVSIHVPARGTTTIWPSMTSKRSCFNPRSRKGNDQRSGGTPTTPEVSIHVPARGTTACIPLRNIRNKRFNPRSRKGNDSRSIGTMWQPLCFNPRSRKGNDAPDQKVAERFRRFQSTFPQGERQQLPTIFICSPCLYLCNYTNTSCSTQVLPPIIAFFLNFS